MKPDPAFSELIGRIYDCALDTKLWPGVLGEITEAVRGVMADLSVFEPLQGTARFAAYHNWPQDLMEAAIANMHLNPGAPMGLVVPLCQPHSTARDLGIDAMHASRYWKNAFAGRGYYDYVVTVVTRTVSSFGVWGVSGTEARGAFGEDDLELARLLSPHIRRAVEISGVLGQQRVEAGTLRAALDALTAAALIVEPGGRILFRNASAETELARGCVFRESKGRLTAVTPGAAQLLASFRSSGSILRGRDAELQDQSGSHVLHAIWVRLETAVQDLGSPILILLRKPEAGLRTPLSATAARYSLTAAETQVLAQALNGQTLEEAAAILGVARSTVKTHLDAIYRKTDTRRRAELVRLAMSLASPLGIHPEAT
jgi:DNA-binding CsgD family transcriptional regulator/PAS domain-containing protein